MRPVQGFTLLAVSLLARLGFFSADLSQSAALRLPALLVAAKVAAVQSQTQSLRTRFSTARNRYSGPGRSCVFWL